jgi:hypothetical protein
VLTVPVLWFQQGDGFEHARLAALMALVVGQCVTVPIGLVIGFVLGTLGVWVRTPGYVFGAVTTGFGVVVVLQALAATRWVDTRPTGLGDPDLEGGLVFMTSASGVVTVVVGMAVVLLRWAGYDSRTAPVRERRRRR